MWTVPQTGGVVPGPRLATPDTSQDKTQQHHHAQPLRPDTDHFLQLTITANIDRDYLSLNTPPLFPPLIIFVLEKLVLFSLRNWI